MIKLERAAKHVKIGNSLREVLEPTSLSIPVARRIAFLGPSNPDKLTVINMLAGISMPNAGHIIRRARVSYPVGFTGGFDAKLSVRRNIEHAARLYGADIAAVIEFVRQVVDLGRSFDRPLNHLDPQVRQALAWAVTYSIPFDIYLHSTELRKSTPPVVRSLFEMRARTCGIIVPTRDFQFVRAYCDMALVLHNGRLSLYDDVDFALRIAAELDPGLSASKRKAAAIGAIDPSYAQRPRKPQLQRANLSRYSEEG